MLSTEIENTDFKSNFHKQHDYLYIFVIQVTWRREDNGELTLKDNSGTKQLSKYNSIVYFAELAIPKLYLHQYFQSFVHLLIVTSFSGEVLKLTKLSRSEMGSYLCIASNGKYSFSFYVFCINRKTVTFVCSLFLYILLLRKRTLDKWWIYFFLKLYFIFDIWLRWKDHLYNPNEFN